MTGSEGRWAIALLVMVTMSSVLAYRLGTAREETRIEQARLVTLRERVTQLETQSRKKQPVKPDTAERVLPAAETKKPRARKSAAEARRDLREAHLRMYADPQARSILVVAAKAYLRRDHPELARVLRLSADEEERLIELLAQQQLNQRERWAARRDDMRFDMHEFEEERRAEEAPRMALLGAEKFGQFQRYIDSSLERHRVRLFRAQLGEGNDLDDETAERLIAMLSVERAAREEKARNAADSHETVLTMGTQFGAVSVQRDGLAKAAAELEAYDRRLANLADPVLDTTQLQRFTEFLDRSREAMLALTEEHMEGVN